MMLRPGVSIPDVVLRHRIRTEPHLMKDPGNHRHRPPENLWLSLTRRRMAPSRRHTVLKSTFVLTRRRDPFDCSRRRRTRGSWAAASWGGVTCSRDLQGPKSRAHDTPFVCSQHDEWRARHSAEYPLSQLDVMSEKAGII